jgi:hypothetical protein
MAVIQSNAWFSTLVGRKVCVFFWFLGLMPAPFFCQLLCTQLLVAKKTKKRRNFSFSRERS